MPRTGKIAKLPRPVRDELNRRLEQSVPGRALADWLNSLPEVQEILLASYNGEPVSEQNLCNWRRTGFAAWQTRQEFYDRVQDLSTGAAELEPLTARMADHAAQLLATHFALVLSANLYAAPSAAAGENPPLALTETDTPDTSTPRPASADSSTPGVSSPPSSPESRPPAPSSVFNGTDIRPLCQIARAVATIRRGNLDASRHQLAREQSRDDQTARLPAEREPLLSSAAPTPSPAPSSQIQSAPAVPAPTPTPPNQPKSSYLKIPAIPSSLPKSKSPHPNPHPIPAPERAPAPAAA